VVLNIAAFSEAFALGAKAGVDPDVLYQVIRVGLAGSNALDAKIPKILERNFKPGFKIRLHYKDLKNVLETARELMIPLPLTFSVQQTICGLINEGKGEEDHSAITCLYEQPAKVLAGGKPSLRTSKIASLFAHAR